MQVTLSRRFVESDEFRSLWQGAQAWIEEDEGLRDEGLYRQQILGRIEQVLDIDGVETLTLEDAEAVRAGIVKRRQG